MKFSPTMNSPALRRPAINSSAIIGLLLALVPLPLSSWGQVPLESDSANVEQPLESETTKSASQSRSTPAPRKFEFTRHRSVTYANFGDDEELLCDVYVPEGEGPFPAILMIHGGAWRSGTKLHMKGHAESAAEKGFVAVAINYRHAPQHRWPAQIDDCRQALEWMIDQAEKYQIDPQRIALWGYSAGGHLATYIATRREEVAPRVAIQCVVCGGGPVDLTVYPKDFPFLVYFLGATRRQAPERYKEASPITHLTRNDPPIFFYHGENDLLVPLTGVEKMVEKAKRMGVRCELMLVPQKEHILTFFDQDSFDRGLEFIEQQMKQDR